MEETIRTFPGLPADFNRVELEAKDTNNMVGELYQFLANNPTFTGLVELYGSLKCKTVDRYYAYAFCKDGKFHNQKGCAVFQNYRDEQYVEFHKEGKFISSASWDYFEKYCEPKTGSPLRFVNLKVVDTTFNY